MIKAYLACISTLYEGEDIEIRYSIFQDGDLIKKKSYFKKYSKPALCGLVAMQELLKELEEFMEERIVVVVNDGALFEMLEGRSRTHKEEVQNLGKRVRKQLDIFSNIEIENVSGNQLEIQEWNNILKP